MPSLHHLKCHILSSAINIRTRIVRVKITRIICNKFRKFGRSKSTYTRWNGSRRIYSLFEWFKRWSRVALVFNLNSLTHITRWREVGGSSPEHSRRVAPTSTSPLHWPIITSMRRLESNRYHLIIAN